MRTAFVVRETRGHWIRDVVAAVRREGFRAELVTEALDDAERAELTPIVDGFVVVGDVRDPEAVADAIRARDPEPGECSPPPRASSRAPPGWPDCSASPAARPTSSP